MGKDGTACAADACTDTECCKAVTCASTTHDCQDGFERDTDKDGTACAADACADTECCKATAIPTTTTMAATTSTMTTTQAGESWTEITTIGAKPSARNF